MDFNLFGDDGNLGKLDNNEDGKKWIPVEFTGHTGEMNEEDLKKKGIMMILKCLVLQVDRIIFWDGEGGERNRFRTESHGFHFRYFYFETPQRHVSGIVKNLVVYLVMFWSSEACSCLEMGILQSSRALGINEIF